LLFILQDHNRRQLISVLCKEFFPLDAAAAAEARGGCVGMLQTARHLSPAGCTITSAAAASEGIYYTAVNLDLSPLSVRARIIRENCVFYSCAFHSAEVQLWLQFLCRYKLT
jgi:hypothetical protein